MDQKEHKAFYRRLLAPLGASSVTAPITKGEALRVFGVRGEIHPDDVAPPQIYPDMRTALLYKRANREAHGLDVIGPREVEGLGILAVIDIRGAIREANARWQRENGSPVAYVTTDPSLPDDWRK